MYSSRTKSRAVKVPGPVRVGLTVIVEPLTLVVAASVILTISTARVLRSRVAPCGSAAGKKAFSFTNVLAPETAVGSPIMRSSPPSIVISARIRSAVPVAAGSSVTPDPTVPTLTTSTSVPVKTSTAPLIARSFELFGSVGSKPVISTVSAPGPVLTVVLVLARVLTTVKRSSPEPSSTSTDCVLVKKIPPS